MSAYRGYLFNMVTDKGCSVLITSIGSKGALLLKVTCNYTHIDHVQFKDMDTLQNFIHINTDKSLTTEQLLDKLTHILYENEVEYYD